MLRKHSTVDVVDTTCKELFLLYRRCLDLHFPRRHVVHLGNKTIRGGLYILASSKLPDVAFPALTYQCTDDPRSGGPPDGYPLTQMGHITYGTTSGSVCLLRAMWVKHK